jgi:predicted amino acid-binding ACT domain protein
VEGDDKPGLGRAIAQATASAGINFAFFIAQVISKRFSAILGFETAEDARSLSEYSEFTRFEYKLLRFRLRGPQHAAPKMISRTGS